MQAADRGRAAADQAPHVRSTAGRESLRRCNRRATESAWPAPDLEAIRAEGAGWMPWSWWSYWNAEAEARDNLSDAEAALRKVAEGDDEPTAVGGSTDRSGRVAHPVRQAGGRGRGRPARRPSN